MKNLTLAVAVLFAGSAFAQDATKKVDATKAEEVKKEAEKK